jgi:hypothetical protein
MMNWLLEFAHHKYCLGGASHDEIIAAMIDACSGIQASLAAQLTADVAVPPRRDQ